MRKRFSIMIVVVMVAFTIATGIVIGYSKCISKDNNQLELASLQDLSIPDDLDTNEFGLFFYDNNHNRIRSTEKNVPFDLNKPLVVYFDGHPNNLGDESVEDLHNLEGWQNKGYNTAIFTWKPLYDTDLYSAEKKIWKTSPMGYTNADGVYLQNSRASRYSVAETFAAYYYDFLYSAGYKNREIRWQGHSLGANLAVAAMDYISCLENIEDIFEYMPSRITMLDALFTDMYSNAYINWVVPKTGQEEYGRLIYDAIRKAKTFGVSFEYIKSSNILDIFLKDSQIFDKIKDEVCFLKYDGGWLDYKGLDYEKAKHNLSFRWYNALLDYDIPLDYGVTGIQQFGISPNTPVSYIYARMGTEYLTLESGADIAKDKQISRNANIPFVAGFAFEDKDKDGNNNSAVNNRVDGVRVELYLKNQDQHKLIGSTVTKSGGYYQLPIEPIYIIGVDERDFYIKVVYTGKYQISAKSGESFLMNNMIGKDNLSEIFTIYKKSDLKIINIGLTRP